MKLCLFTLSAERDDLSEKFSASVLDLQQKSSLKYFVLEKKLGAMREELEVRDAQLHALVANEADNGNNGELF